MTLIEPSNHVRLYPVVSGVVVSGDVSGTVVSGDVSGVVVAGEVVAVVVAGEVVAVVVAGEVVAGEVVAGEDPDEPCTRFGRVTHHNPLISMHVMAPFVALRAVE
jgi:hypothetical protein